MPYKDPEKAREYQREYQRRWRVAHPEKVAAAQKKWRAAHPDYSSRRRGKDSTDPEKVAKRRERQRQWRLRNPDKRREAHRRWRQAHRDQYLAAWRARAAADPEGYRRRRRAWYWGDPALAEVAHMVTMLKKEAIKRGA